MEFSLGHIVINCTPPDVTSNKSKPAIQFSSNSTNIVYRQTLMYILHPSTSPHFYNYLHSIRCDFNWTPAIQLSIYFSTNLEKYSHFPCITGIIQHIEVSDSVQFSVSFSTFFFRNGLHLAP